MTRCIVQVLLELWQLYDVTAALGSLFQYLKTLMATTLPNTQTDPTLTHLMHVLGRYL